MIRKMVVLLVMLSLVLALTSICLAAEKPLGDINNANDVINKVLTGRTLDPIEGVWVRDENRVIAIVKSSVIYPNQNPPKNDYLVIKISENGHSHGEVWHVLTPTNYNFSFKGESNIYWKLLSPNLLEFGVALYANLPNDIYVRTYPTLN